MNPAEEATVQFIEFRVAFGLYIYFMQGSYRASPFRRLTPDARSTLAARVPGMGWIADDVPLSSRFITNPNLLRKKMQFKHGHWLAEGELRPFRGTAFLLPATPVLIDGPSVEEGWAAVRS